MGLAFSNIAVTRLPTFFETLIAQARVKVQEFSFYLGRAVSGTADQSELTLGGRDPSKFTGAITQVPVTTQGYWQVALDSVVVNGVSAGLVTAGQAAIDTGTTIILAPTAAAIEIHSRIPLAFPVPLVSGSSSINLFAYPCNTAARFIPAIRFAGTDFVIDPRDFNFGVLTTSFADLIGNSSLLGKLLDKLIPQLCISAIAGADISPTTNLYVVGDTFLKNWYSIYSYNNAGGKPSVSFAKSK